MTGLAPETVMPAGFRPHQPDAPAVTPLRVAVGD
jgi:hypothetical protein